MTVEDNKIVVKFEVHNMSSQKYDEVIRWLEAAGVGAPPGRLYHLCYGIRVSLQVIDVYDSPHSFEAFGQTLMPILQELGIEVRSDVQPVYDTITALAGSAA